MRTDYQTIQKTLSIFRSEKVMTIDQLATSLGITSRNTHRHLKKWRALTSYNHNGRFYALPEVTCFNEYGLWCYQGIHFSKHGNLRKTFIYLVRNSDSGLEAVEAARLLKLNPQSFLSHFREDPDLRRKKNGRHFIYFSSDPVFYKKQMSERGKLLDRPLITDTVGIAVLVEKIRHPSSGVSDLVGRLRKQGVNVTAELITDFFGRHDLLKKT